jgi:hypothetical protein
MFVEDFFQGQRPGGDYFLISRSQQGLLLEGEGLKTQRNRTRSLMDFILRLVCFAPCHSDKL